MHLQFATLNYYYRIIIIIAHVSSASQLWMSPAARQRQRPLRSDLVKVHKANSCLSCRMNKLWSGLLISPLLWIGWRQSSANRSHSKTWECCFNWKIEFEIPQVLIIKTLLIWVYYNWYWSMWCLHIYNWIASNEAIISPPCFVKTTWVHTVYMIHTLTSLP